MSDHIGDENDVPDVTDTTDETRDDAVGEPRPESDEFFDAALDDDELTVVGGDGRGRRRTALLVVAVAVVTGLIGMYIGTRIESPADRAAARSAPEPSLVTVPVERRELRSELTLSGEVAYNEPTVIQLAGTVGIDASETEVITDLAPVGEELQEGDVIAEVTGRPVITLQGALPMYRRMVVGTAGPDVAQLEAALVRLGYSVVSVDTVFDASTATAVEQMYADAGYTAEGPSVTELDALTAAREAVRQADENVRSAEEALGAANQPMLESERLQITQAVESARAAVPAAEANATITRTEQDQFVTSAQTSFNTAVVARDAAVAVRDAARVAGAIDPNTGEPYSAERLAALEVEAAVAQESLTAAETGVVTAQTQRTQAVTAADQAVSDATFQLQLSEAQYTEATASGDTSALDEAVASAASAAAQAATSLAALEAATGTRISPGELVFVPVLPSTVTESYVALGSTVQGPIGAIATSETLVIARISRADSGLVAVGASVEVEVRDTSTLLMGTVLSVGPAQARQSPGFDQGGDSGSGDTARLEVVVAPDDSAALRNYVYYGARIRVAIEATDGEVLVVPVAALSVGPDQTSQVEVERTAATDETPAITEIVAVEVGLTSDGLTEVRPTVDGALAEGDRVVIGVETNIRQNATDRPATDTDSGDDSGDDDADDSGDDSGDDGGSGEGFSSPLGDLLGWGATDPVEDRRKQLEVEEFVATCMRDQGFEYEPIDYASQFNNDPDAELYSDPAAYGEKYGYGIMRNYELYESGDGIDSGPTFVDPNQEYVSSLSPAENEAYYAALYGDQSYYEDVGDDDGEFVPPPIEEQGCQGQGYNEVYGDQSLDPGVDEVLNDFYANQQNDPRLDAAYDEWSACMADVADEFDLPAVPERPDYMYGVVDALKYQEMGAELIPVATEAEMNEAFESGDVVANVYTSDTSGFVMTGELAELTGAQIEQLATQELQIWQADRSCTDEAGIFELQQELEQAVVDELLSRFPELGE